MTSYGPDLGCCATYPDPPFSLTYGEAFWTVHDPPPITNGIPIASTWTGSALITIGSDGSAARWTPSEGWATIPQVPLLTGLDCTQRLASANGRVVAIVCNEAAVWDELEARWYVIASPESVAWHSNVCELLPGPKGRLQMYVVCTSYLVGNQFIRIDLSAVEATRYSETAVHSQWKLLPNPAATHLDGTTMVGAGAVYDPATDSWRVLPPIPDEFILFGSFGDFVNDEFIIMGENWKAHPTGSPPLVGLAYSPLRDAWRTIAGLRDPARDGGRFFGSLAAVRHGEELAVFLPAEYSADTPSIAFYSPSTDSWRYVDGAPATRRERPLISGNTFLAYLAAEGTVLLHGN